MFEFLRTLDLKPQEWSSMVKATNKASPYIGEVLTKGFSITQATIVLLTPDDEARLKKEYRKENDPVYESELVGQPRPNVFIEAGMALGMNEKNTLIVEIGNLRPISDIFGRHTIRLDTKQSEKSRHEFVERLEGIGCKINRSGTDWLSAGDFSLRDEEINETQDDIESNVSTTESLDSLTTLAKFCNMSNEQINDILDYENGKLFLLKEPDSQSIAERVIKCSQIILTVYKKGFNVDWVKGSEIAPILKERGIPIVHLAKYLNGNKQLFKTKKNGKTSILYGITIPGWQEGLKIIKQL